MRILRWTLVVLGCLCSAAPAASAPVNPYVIGGTTSAIADLPFAAAVFVNLSATTFATCSGSVIAPNLVLTAAHCVLNDAGQPLTPDYFQVRTGSPSYFSGGVVSFVSAVRVYPYLSLSTLAGDAALLTLVTPTTAPPVRLATTADASLYAAAQPDTTMPTCSTMQDGWPSAAPTCTDHFHPG